MYTYVLFLSFWALLRRFGQKIHGSKGPGRCRPGTLLNAASHRWMQASTGPWGAALSAPVGSVAPGCAAGGMGYPPVMAKLWKPGPIEFNDLTIFI